MSINHYGYSARFTKFHYRFLFLAGGISILLFFGIRPTSAQTNDDLSSLVLSNGKIEVVTFTPDGAFIVVMTKEAILLIDSETHSIVKTYSYPDQIRTGTAMSNRLHFSPDGSRMLVALEYFPTSVRSIVRLLIWNIQTDELELDLIPDKEFFMDVDFSSDGEKLYLTRNRTDGDNLALRVLDAHTGESLATYKNGYLVHRLVSVPNTHQAWVTESQYQSNGSTKGLIVLYDMDTGERLRKLNGSHDWYISSLDLSSDGSRLITSSPDGTVRIWDTVSGNNLFTLTGSPDRDRPVEISEDGRYAFFVTIGNDVLENREILNVWDLQTQQTKSTHEIIGGISDIAVSPHNQSYAIGGYSGTFLHWNFITDESILGDFPLHPLIFSVLPTSQEDQIVIIDIEGVHLYDLTTRQNLTDYSLPFSNTYSNYRCAFQGNDLWFAYLNETDQYVPTLFNWDTNTSLVFQPSFKNAVGQIVVDSTFRFLAAADNEWLRVWDIATRNLQFEIKLSDYLRQFLFSPDGNRFLYQTYERLVLGDSLTGAIEKEIVQTYNNRDLVFSPDQNWLVLCTDQITFVSTQTLEPVFYLQANGNRYQTAEFTPDGNFLFAGTAMDQVELWDIRNGKILWTFGDRYDSNSDVTLSNQIRDITLTSNTKNMIVTHSDGTAKIWPVVESMFVDHPDAATATMTPTFTSTPTLSTVPTPTEVIFVPTGEETPFVMATSTPTFNILATPTSTPQPTHTPIFLPPTDTPTPPPLTATPTIHDSTSDDITDPVGIDDWGLY